jgi:hypothetical protein
VRAGAGCAWAQVVTSRTTPVDLLNVVRPNVPSLRLASDGSRRHSTGLSPPLMSITSIPSGLPHASSELPGHTLLYVRPSGETTVPVHPVSRLLYY